MGRLNAEGMADMDMPLQAVLHWHLRSNHYPPVPVTMIDPCIAAIDAANEGDYDAPIDLPEGVSYKGQTTAPAWAIIDQHHLDTWIDQDYDETL